MDRVFAGGFWARGAGLATTLGLSLGFGCADANEPTAAAVSAASDCTGGTGGDPAECVHVAPDGDDALALSTNGAVPFQSVQAAIDFVHTHGDGRGNVCLAAGDDCGIIRDYPLPADVEFRMLEGISLFGKYESIGWTRCDDPGTVTRLIAKTERGVVFDDTIASETQLDGVSVLAFDSPVTTAITVDGASGVRLVNVSAEKSFSWVSSARGLELSNGAEVNVSGGDYAALQGSDEAIGIRSVSSRLTLSGASVRANGSNGAVYGLWLEDSSGSHITATSFGVAPGGPRGASATAVAVLGESAEVTFEDCTLTAADGDRQSVGLALFGCLDTAPVFRGGTISVTNFLGGDLEEETYGIWSDFGCATTVESSSVDITAGAGDTGIGIACAGSCTLTDNDVTTRNDSRVEGTRATGIGVVCDGCVEVSDNRIVGLSSVYGCLTNCDYDSTGLVLEGSGTLVDGNDIAAGCLGGPRRGSAVGMLVSGSARVQNNLVRGAADCEGLGSTPGETSSVGLVARAAADVHSNLLAGGDLGSGHCDTAALALERANYALVRNNILDPGACPNGFNVDQRSADAFAAVFLNNAFSPGPTKEVAYRIQGLVDPNSISQINAISGSDDNFAAADCQLPLVESSTCVDRGTPDAAPALDFEGDTRDTEPDVGPDEFVAVVDPCAGPNPPTWVLRQELVPSDGGPEDTAQASTAASGDTLALGAFWDDDETPVKHPGMVYVFERVDGSYQEVQRLTAPDGFPVDLFGRSVALDADTLLVGAQLARAAYVFVRTGSGWTFQQKLTAPDGMPGDNFGEDVAVAAQTAVVASSFAAYVFERSGTAWSFVQKLELANEGQPGGVTVAPDGNSVLVGFSCRSDLDPGCLTFGSEYVRDGSAWVEQSRLTSAVFPGPGSRGVALAGETAFVSSVSSGSSAIGVFAFTGSSWTDQGLLSGTDGFPLVTLDGPVSARDDRVLASEDDQIVHSFVRTGESFTLDQVLTLSGPNLISFGREVALERNTAVGTVIRGAQFPEARVSLAVFGLCLPEP